MKQIDNSDLVTKSFLKTELIMLKEELKKEIKKEITEEVDKKAKQYRDQILTKLDEVMGQLGTLREENEIGAYQTRDLREEVENHDKRIKKLESLQKSA